MPGFIERFRKGIAQTYEEKRQKEINDLLPTLINAGYGPAELASIYKNYVKSGEMRLPTERARMLHQGSDIKKDATDAGPISTREPIQFKAKRKEGPKKIGRFDENTGKIDFLDVPEGFDLERMITIRKDRPTREPDEEKQAKAVAQKTLEKMQLMNLLEPGREYSPEEIEVFRDAASIIPGLDLDVSTGTKKTGFPGFRKEKEFAKNPRVVKKGQVEEEKKLTPELAKEYLRKANGNKDEARKRAKRDGYKF